MHVLGFKHHGGLDAMDVFELPEPPLGSNDVLIEVKASAFNHLDIWVRQGWPGLKLQLPHISGSDAAGMILAVGDSVDESIQKGMRVCVDPGMNTREDVFTEQGEHSVSPYYHILGEQVPGTHAQYLVVPAKNVLPIPDPISFETAAAAGLVSVTAWRMLIHRAKLKVGETVLIHGAGGGVNSMAIQLAKVAGATVYATTSSEEKMEHAKALGADEVVHYRNDPEWSKKIRQWTDDQGVDIVVDNVGQATMKSSLQLVKRGGRIVIVGNTSGAEYPIDLRYLFSKQISLIGSTMGNHYDFRQAMKLVFSEKIKPVIHKTFPLRDGVTAMGLLERGEQFGKIVLVP